MDLANTINAVLRALALTGLAAGLVFIALHLLIKHLESRGNKQ